MYLRSLLSVVGYSIIWTELKTGDNQGIHSKDTDTRMGGIATSADQIASWSPVERTWVIRFYPVYLHDRLNYKKNKINMEFELKSISLGEQRKKSVILDLFFFKHLKNNKIKIILHTLNIYLPHQLFIETVRYIFIPQINTTS